MAELMREFDALVQECGSIKVSRVGIRMDGLSKRMRDNVRPNSPPHTPNIHILRQARLEHEHDKTAVKDTADLHARLIALQGTARHALLRAEREAALWRGAEHKREVMHQHAHAHEHEGAPAAPAAVMPVGGEN